MIARPFIPFSIVEYTEQHPSVLQDRSDSGSLEEEGVFARTANFARLPLVGLAECRAKVRKRVHPERQLCAGGEAGGEKLYSTSSFANWQ